MSFPVAYDPTTDRRSGANSMRRGLCSRVWCREPAVVQAETASGQLRYACAKHRDDPLMPDAGNTTIAAGAGDGLYHDAPFLKKGSRG